MARSRAAGRGSAPAAAPAAVSQPPQPPQPPELQYSEGMSWLNHHVKLTCAMLNQQGHARGFQSNAATMACAVKRALNGVKIVAFEEETHTCMPAGCCMTASSCSVAGCPAGALSASMVCTRRLPIAEPVAPMMGKEPAQHPVKCQQMPVLTHIASQQVAVAAGVLTSRKRKPSVHHLTLRCGR